MKEKSECLRLGGKRWRNCEKHDITLLPNIDIEGNLKFPNQNCNWWDMHRVTESYPLVHH